MNLFASVLHLSRKDVSALKINNPYALHLAVYKLFADVRTTEEKQQSLASGFLYADQGGNYKSRKILLLSNRPPNQQIDNQYGQVLTKPIAENFLNYQHYRFKVIINPTKRASASRKLIPIKGREAISSWFTERTENNWGFKLVEPQLQIDAMNVLQFKGKNQRQITQAQAHLQGVLTVTNRQLFKQSFATGIGRGKAFGCGLLQLVPLVEN